MSAHTEVGKPIVVTDASFAEDVLASPVPVVVDFWAPWGPPCRVIAPIMNDLAAEYASRLTIAKLDSDENPRTRVQMGVQGIPTLIIFKNGQEVGRLVGARSKQQYRDQFDALVG
jgi:thioredoxin 1